jgi:hypothetical protein
MAREHKISPDTQRPNNLVLPNGMALQVFEGQKKKQPSEAAEVFMSTAFRNYGTRSK